MEFNEVINFWFEELSQKQWWVKDPDLDQLISERFSAIHAQAKEGALSSWRTNSLGRLAEVIVLDQFSRNIYRDQPEAFAQDEMALELAKEAVVLGEDQKLDVVKRAFLYMPYMHSESVTVHEEAVKLFSKEGLESNLDFEYKHKAIIDRFGRYPHRNAVVGRESTPEELEFLKGPGSSF